MTQTHQMLSCSVWKLSKNSCSGGSVHGKLPWEDRLIISVCSADGKQKQDRIVPKAFKVHDPGFIHRDNPTSAHRMGFSLFHQGLHCSMIAPFFVKSCKRRIFEPVEAVSNRRKKFCVWWGQNENKEMEDYFVSLVVDSLFEVSVSLHMLVSLHIHISI